MTNRVRVRFTRDHYEVLTPVSSTTWPEGWKAAFDEPRARGYVDAGVAEYVKAPAPRSEREPGAQQTRPRRRR